MIEILESRIAPAAVFNYTDIDGDKVSIHTSNGTNTDLASAAHVVGGQLQLLDLSANIFDGTNVIFTVTQAGHGDGLAAVGKIDGGSNELGDVTVKGDLGVIDSDGLTSLNVRSLGRYFTLTQAAGGNLDSVITGSLDSLNVTSDVKDAYVNVTGSITSINIGGSLIDGLVGHGGSISSGGSIGTVKIGGNIVGSDFDNSGSIISGGGIVSVTVGGSIMAGSGSGSGEISSVANIGAVEVGHNIKGGAIHSGGALTTITVGGSLINGSIVTTNALSSVSIAHDVTNLGAITAGTSLGSLRIGGSLLGTVSSTKDIGSVTIGHDLIGGSTANAGSIESGGALKMLTIGGSVVGGTADQTGYVSSVSAMGPVTIGGNLRGGSNLDAGEILAFGNLASVSIGGSIIGGSSVETGAVFGFGKIGSVTVGHDVAGATGFDSGEISSAGDLGSVTIGGSLLGGTKDRSGYINSGGVLGTVIIGHDLTGASYVNGPLTDSGYILGNQINSVTIGGSVVAGNEESSQGISEPGSLTNNAAIKAVESIGSIIVKGNVIGSNIGGGAVNPVVFSAQSQAQPTAASDLAIGKISISGNAEYLNVLAGYSPTLSPKDGNAQIGTVHVRGDWLASNLIAGAVDTNGDGFGNADDKIIGGGASIAKIASIIIGGIVEAAPDFSLHFGFESHAIGSVSINGFTIPVTSLVQLSPITGDVTIRLV